MKNERKKAGKKVKGLQFKSQLNINNIAKISAHHNYHMK